MNYAGSAAGQYRIRQNALARYELYQGVDGAPDFSGAATATSATLPFNHALSASHVHQVCVRRRNAYNLVSQNNEVETYDIGADGSINTTAPSAPTGIAISAASGGAFRVQAQYNYLEDGDYRATQWLIYLTTNGVDPDPDSDTPTEVAIAEIAGVAVLDWTSAAAAHGATGKVLLRVRRVDAGPTNVDSSNTTVYSAMASTAGPAEPGAACQWLVEPAGAWTTIWNSGTDARIDWIANPGVLRFIVGGVVVAGIGAGRRLLLKGVLTEDPWESQATQAADIVWDGTTISFGLGGSGTRGVCATIDANGNMRVGSFEEMPGYPDSVAFSSAIEWHTDALEFGPDLATRAMRLEAVESGGVYNAVLKVKGITENAWL